MTNTNEGAAKRRKWWVFAGLGVVVAGVLTALALEAIDRVREAAARVH
jgi:hypothetical protein